jgi:threonine dehydratase
MTVRIPGAAALRAAARRIAPWVLRTPLLESEAVNRRLGGRLLVKAESLQRTGSFKARGAFNVLAQLDAAQRRAGVVAFSSGNHAQGVAAAAQHLGIPAVIVMPADAPAVKIANTRAYGAAVVTFDRYRDDREAIARAIAAERGATTVPPFDHPGIIAGQASVGVELAAQAAALGAPLDAVVVPCSGGGLVAGCALALAAESPKTAVYSAEPAGLDDMRRSLAAGTRQTNDPDARSICDALLAPTPGALPFAIAARHLAGGLAVSDDEVRRAVAVAANDYKLVLEPSGAAALATVIFGKLPLAGRTVAVVASGGNVDMAAFAAMVGS